MTRLLPLARVFRSCRRWRVALGLATFCVVGDPARLEAAAQETQQVLVKFRPAPGGAGLQEANRLPAGARVSRRLPLAGWQVVELPAGTSTRQAVEWFRSRPDVIQAEPNAAWKLHVVPSDPQWPRLFGLDRIGAPAAWDRTRGNSNVIVAVLDTGITLDHPDLAPNLWRNPGEFAKNRIDDDRNGRVDDLVGWDFLDGDADPSDDAGHGTHVAGTIGAVGNNGRGVVGVCWEVRLLAVRVGSVDGFASTVGLVEAFDYVTTLRRSVANIRVVNCSWGGAYPSAALKEAIGEAGAAGLLVVCSAGNDRQDNDVLPAFPAGYDCPEIVSVAASTACDEPASFSNYGRTTVDLAAPGSGVLSTYRASDRYAMLSGTSMAAPHVSGAAALLFALRPSLTPVEARALLLDTVDRLPGWEGLVASGGRLNVDRALSRAAEGGKPSFTPPLEGPRHLVAVSRTPGGRWGSGHSPDGAISADGRWVAFSSAATNLVASDTEGFADIFLHDRVSNTVVRVSQTLMGVGGKGKSSAPVVSADGRFVAFVTEASNLVSNDGNRASDVLLWDRTTRRLELVSKRRGSSSSGTGASELPALSADGMVVAFASEAPDLVASDRNAARDVFVRDRTRGLTERVSVANGGSEARGWSDAPSISAEGRWVAFHSSATNLVSGDTNQAWDVFVRDRTLARTELNSVQADGVSPANRDSLYPSLSADGRFLLFSSRAGNLDGGAGDIFLKLFLRDRTTKTVVRIGSPREGGTPGGEIYADALSADGRFATFTSDDPGLAPGGMAGLYRAFVYDRLAGTVQALAVSDAGYVAEDSAFLPRISADGRALVFASYGFNLAPGDGNGVADVFVLDRGQVRPDLGIRRADGSAFTGLGILNPNVSQRVGLEVLPGARTNAEVRLVNGGAARAFRLRLSSGPAGAWGWRVATAINGADIGAELAGGGWTTPELPPGGELRLRGEVFRSAEGDAEPTLALRLTAHAVAVGDVAELDAVSIVATTSWSPPGSMLVSRGTDGRPASRNSEVAAVGGDGSRIVFSSQADHLDARPDANFQSDVFLIDRTAGTIRRISDATTTVGANADSRFPSISADGRKVAFQSRASNLAYSDTNHVEDVFVRDVDSGAIELASRAAYDVQGNRGSQSAILSSNGRAVVFTSFASNLVPEDTNQAQDVFLRDLAAGTIVCVSRSTTGAFGNADSEAGTPSADSRFVVFTSFADNLGPVDRNGFADVYLLDRQSNVLDLVSANPAGEAADGPSGGGTVSNDGRWVTFFSCAGDLAPGASATERQAYLWDRRTRSVRAVADLLPALPAGWVARGALVSPNGRWLGIAAGTRCGAVAAAAQVSVFDREREQLHPVSVRRDGTWGDDHSFLGRFDSGGRYLVFESDAPNLRIEPAHPATQVYLADLARAAVDGLLRGSGNWRGEGMNTGTEWQTAVQLGALGAAGAPFVVRVQNDGNTTDRLVLRAGPPPPAPIRIGFYSAQGPMPDMEVPIVTAQGWRTPPLGPGQSLDLFAWVTFADAFESEVVIDLEVTSLIEPRQRDSLRLVSWLDSDRDGMPDAWEQRFFGNLKLATRTSDGDGDGAPDVSEWNAGTDPANPASVLSLAIESPVTPDLLTLSWNSTDQTYYGVERRDPGDSGFVTLSTEPLPATGGMMRWEDEVSLTNTGAFYRVRAERP